jgi:hypothetical protein
MSRDSEEGFDAHLMDDSVSPRVLDQMVKLGLPQDSLEETARNLALVEELLTTLKCVKERLRVVLSAKESKAVLVSYMKKNFDKRVGDVILHEDLNGEDFVLTVILVSDRLPRNIFSKIKKCDWEPVTWRATSDLDGYELEIKVSKEQFVAMF